jgi:hypothetical protein
VRMSSSGLLLISSQSDSLLFITAEINYIHDVSRLDAEM